MQWAQALAVPWDTAGVGCMKQNCALVQAGEISL